MARAENLSAARSVEASLHWQRFHVPFEYPVYFTEGLLDTSNDVLVQAVARIEPDKRHRCLVFVDDGLVAARPGVCDELVAYAAHHGERMDLVAAPIQVPGGEVIKKDLHFVERMQRALHDNHIDRHSFCIGIGGLIDEFKFLHHPGSCQAVFQTVIGEARNRFS